MGLISRGFTGKRDTTETKLPPGQYLTKDFPVLSAGPTPRISLDAWEFSIANENGESKQWDWTSFRALPIRSDRR